MQVTKVNGRWIGPSASSSVLKALKVSLEQKELEDAKKNPTAFATMVLYDVSRS